MGVNETSCGDHFTKYTDIESLCCIIQQFYIFSTVLYFKDVSIFLKLGKKGIKDYKGRRIGRSRERKRGEIKEW